MIRANSDIHVAAPPEEVFDRLVDMRTEVDWNPMTLEMAKVTDGDVARGTRFEGKMRRVGPMRMEVTEYDRPRHLAMHGGSRGVDVTWAADVEPADAGSRLRTDLGLDPKGVMKLFAPLMARQAGKQNDQSVAAFKRWMEGGRADA